MDRYDRLKLCEADIRRSQTNETEAQYIIKGYPSEVNPFAALRTGDTEVANAYVYIDSTGRLCIHGGDTGGCLYINPEDLPIIGGDVAPGH